MDESLYDEFGNYIGPELSGSEVSAMSASTRLLLTCCRLGNIACCHTMLLVQNEAEDEMEELPEVDEQLEEAEEAANRRMDMTSAY